MSDVDECEEMETGNKILYCKTDFSVKKSRVVGHKINVTQIYHKVNSLFPSILKNH